MKSPFNPERLAIAPGGWSCATCQTGNTDFCHPEWSPRAEQELRHRVPPGQRCRSCKRVAVRGNRRHAAGNCFARWRGRGAVDGKLKVYGVDGFRIVYIKPNANSQAM